MLKKILLHTLFIYIALCATPLLYAGLFKEVTSEETAIRAAPPVQLTKDLYQGFLPLQGENFSLDLTGFIKSEALYDTRQVVGVRDDLLLIFPEPIKRDLNGNDINHRGQMNQYTLETGYTIELRGPSFDGAKTRAFIEGDFFGRLEVFPASLTLLSNAGNDVSNTFRLRNAYFEITWPHFNFLVGQNWVPMQYPIESPSTVGAGSGTPIEAFGRNPQIRCAYHDDSIDFIAMLLGSIDNVNDGPTGGATRYQRNALMPEIATGFRYKIDSYFTFFGGVISARRITPRLATTQNYKTRESLTTIATSAFAKINTDHLTLYTKLIWGQNMGPYYGMIGGYATDSINPITDERTYTPLHTLSLWTEIIVKPIDHFEPALYMGITKSLGTKKPIFPNNPFSESVLDRTVFGFGTNVDYCFQIAPRIRYYRLPFIFGLEYLYTRTDFGTLSKLGTVINTVPAQNNRFIAAWYYVF